MKSNSTLILQQRNDFERTFKWIKYNIGLGFNHFILFDDNSSDDSLNKLKSLSIDEIIFNIFETDKSGKYFEENNPDVYGKGNDVTDRIWKSYLTGYKFLKENFEIDENHLTGFLDNDEYIVPQNESLFNLIKNIEQIRIEIDSYDFENENSFMRWSDNFKNQVAFSRVKSLVKTKYFEFDMFSGNFGGIHYLNSKISAYRNSNELKINHYRKINRPDISNVFDYYDDKILTWRKFE